MPVVTLDIGQNPLTFVEDSVIAAQRGPLERVVHQMTKVSEEPLVQKTEPYEAIALYLSSVQRDTSGRWQMWYGAYGDVGREMKIPLMGKFTGHMATSNDGLHWEKPDLGAVDLGIGPNNLCSFPGGVPAPSGAIFYEPDDPDPNRRYKMIYYRPSYYLAYSADGIRWTPAQQEPVWPNGAGDGLEETWFFMRDELRGKYRGYMRIWQRHQTIRTSGLGESDDLIHWDGPRIIWEAGREYGAGAQIYGMNVVIEGGYYWALPWMFYNDAELDPAIQQTMRFKLAWSRDGREWHPLSPEMDAVPMGRIGAFDCGMMMSTAPIVKLDDRLRLYYHGWNRLHDQRLVVPGSQLCMGISAAEIRRQGFVSIRAGDDECLLLTERILFRGDALHLNAVTARDGYVLVELLNDGGQIIAGRRFEQSDAFCGDSVDHRLTWQGNGDLSQLFGREIMVRLKLRRADLYALRVAGSPELFTMPLMRQTKCGQVTEPPIIDGVLSDGAWDDFTHSGVADDFSLFTSMTPAPVKTRAMLTHDDTNLYISVDCEEPLSDRLVRGEPTTGFMQRREETIEFRFSAPGQGTHFNQLMVGLSGSRIQAWFSVEEGGSEVIEEPVWQAATSITRGHWYVEMAVPFAALKTATPAAGERWQMNIMRYRHVETENEISNWSCMHGSQHRNDRSGLLVFEK